MKEKHDREEFSYINLVLCLIAMIHVPLCDDREHVRFCGGIHINTKIFYKNVYVVAVTNMGAVITVILYLIDVT
jgi:hypothetical protein